MKKELVNELIELAPVFMQNTWGDRMETCMAWGCTCGNGWFKTLKDLIQKIELINNSIKLSNKQIIADQIKTKFGDLTIYYSITDLNGEKIQNDPFETIVNDLINICKEKCSIKCEKCGVDIKKAVKTKTNWIKRICSNCL